MSKKKSLIEIIIAGMILAVFVGFIAKSQTSKAENKLAVEFLDVGQGDAEYIKTPSGQDILIDGGPDNSVLSELGYVMPISDNDIDLIILSHPHADHLTGLIEVLKRYKVNEIWETGVTYPSATYDEFKKLISDEKISDQFVKAGDTKDFGDGVKLTTIYPLSALKNQTVDNLNNASLVVRLNYGTFSVIFPGDAEKEEQDKILNANLNVTVIKMPHHGSANGANDEFFKIVRPAVAVIEVGKNNKFGHPHAAALNLLKQLAIKYYRTDQDGRVEITTSGNGYNIQTFPSE